MCTTSLMNSGNISSIDRTVVPSGSARMVAASSFGRPQARSRGSSSALESNSCLAQGALNAQAERVTGRVGVHAEVITGRNAEPRRVGRQHTHLSPVRIVNEEVRVQLYRRSRVPARSAAGSQWQFGSRYLRPR